MISFFIAFFTFILPKTLFICFGEKTFLVIATLLLLKQFDLVQMQKENNLIFNKANLPKLLITILIPTLQHDILTFIGFQFFGISILIFSILIIVLIIFFYKIKGYKNIIKTILCYLFVFAILIMFQAPYAFITIDGMKIYEIIGFNWNEFFALLPERIFEFLTIIILLAKNFNLLKINVINPIINNKKVLTTFMVAALLNISMMVFVSLQLCVYGSFIATVGQSMAILILVAIITFTLFNIFAMAITVYFLTSQKLYDKISVKDRIFLLNNFVAEITNAIGSAFDFKEFLKNMNNTIIKTMDVNHSTIIFLDKDTNQLKIELTNLDDSKSIELLSNNINCQLLKNVLINNQPIIDNELDEVEIANKYPFVTNRNIGSLMCVPIYNKSKSGLILIEDEYNGAFDEQSLKLLSIIGQQVSIALDNIQLYKRNQELMDLDYLTNVYNRHYFQSVLQEHFRAAKNNQGYLSLIMLDIDFFKKVNDTYGHLFGDEVLKHVANIIKTNMKKNDIIARYGGEEFVIILPQTDLNIAYEITERLRLKIQETPITYISKEDDQPKEINITASLGISCFPVNSFSEIELMYNADKALYDAKHSGRNQVKIFENKG